MNVGGNKRYQISVDCWPCQKYMLVCVNEIKFITKEKMLKSYISLKYGP